MSNKNSDTLVKSRIERITTHWSVVKDTSHFTLRYAPAIRRYIASMATNSSDVEDILQDFLFRVVKRGFQRENVDEGRFRFYLKAAVRNAVRSHYRGSKTGIDDERMLSEVPSRESSLEDEWTVQWRECLLERAWSALERIESDSKGRFPYTILKLATEFPAENSSQLSRRAAERTGTPATADSFRQQLHRARRKFAALLVDEVTATLEEPTVADVEAELIDLGLIGFVRDRI